MYDHGNKSVRINGEVWWFDWGQLDSIRIVILIKLQLIGGIGLWCDGGVNER